MIRGAFQPLLGRSRGAVAAVKDGGAEAAIMKNSSVLQSACQSQAFAIEIARGGGHAHIVVHISQTVEQEGLGKRAGGAVGLPTAFLKELDRALEFSPAMGFDEVCVHHRSKAKR